MTGLWGVQLNRVCRGRGQNRMGLDGMGQDESDGTREAKTAEIFALIGGRYVGPRRIG